MSVRYEDIYTLYPYLREKYHFDDLTGLVPHTLNRWYRNVALRVTMPDALARHLAKNPHGPLVGDLAQLITWQSGIPRRDFAELSYLVAYLRGGGSTSTRGSACSRRRSRPLWQCRRKRSAA